ncbi:MAG TPA: hypothetical protein VNJ12_01295 [Candidatus Dormibacteraeota bacterium]|nr:hypothetical protein [Candidatus Dormibacteraeota bacterium]
MIRFDRVWLAWLALIAAAVSLAGCATPLGPGFQLRRETLTVHYARRPVAPAVYYHLQVEARNVGNRPLDLLRIQAPRRLVHAAPAGQPGASMPARTSGTVSNGWLPVPLQPPLPQGQSRGISFGYLVLVRGPVVFLEPQGWFPAFLPPRGLFAKSVPWASKQRVAIYVPRGERALTSGRLRRVRTRPAGAETEYVFQIRKKDFPPFLLIGDYREQKVRVRGRNVIFWTSQLFPAACAQTVAGEAVTTTGLYHSLFGRLKENLGPLRVIEIPAGAQAQGPGSNGERKTLPNGVLLSEPPAEACRNGGRFYFILARALAATWFGWAVRPAPGAGAILGTGVQDYAALLAEEHRDGRGERKRQVMEWLAEYDRLSAHARPLAPANLGADPTGDQRRLAGVQSALFFVALEDRLGAEPLRKALRDLVGSLDGSTAGRNELRSVLEREGGKNLYGFFNQWLNREGIPASFRRRYAARESTSGPGKDAAWHSQSEGK